MIHFISRYKSAISWHSSLQHWLYRQYGPLKRRKQANFCTVPELKNRINSIVNHLESLISSIKSCLSTRYTYWQNTRSYYTERSVTLKLRQWWDSFSVPRILRTNISLPAGMVFTISALTGNAHLILFLVRISVRTFQYKSRFFHLYL
jgi:hypothetical protein